ncbi:MULTISPECIES: phenol hydroxylase subunit [Burkholderia cepacia complex]|uniref:Phenol hydroxylase subunit n=1 Tax=Burkholderia pseudomultivorans TaxID=1207504 RepID=A0A6P2MJ04_9BURK|nr:MULTISPECIES: phenol hydroxylase subunit [Burkholderia cepacia complex]VWB80485.1 phenol hydroxylase subunit [Burkholderia pseudomultivorans]
MARVLLMVVYATEAIVTDIDVPVQNPGTVPGACFVRVLGTRNERFIEFEFSIGDPDLAVEMIMPIPYFEEFCQRHGARRLTPEQEAGLELDRCKWQYGQPGVQD